MSKASDKQDAADAKAEAAEQAKEVKAAHRATNQPDNPAGDPTDHSIGGKSAQTADEIKAAAEEDNTIVGKIRRSELFWVNDHPNGGGPYIGISPQNDPNASDASKRLSAVHPLTGVAPRTGLVVKPKDGDAFSIGEGFGPDSQPSDWQKVTKPDGSLLFA